jgi:hypothetical protein
MKLLARTLLAALLVSAFLWSGSRDAFAHEKEPINTEFAPPVEAPIFHFTASRFATTEGTLLTLPALSMEAPIGPRIQFELGIPILRSEPNNGDATTNFGDVGFGLRYQLVPEHRRGILPDIDVNFEMSLPTGDRTAGLGGEAWESSVGVFLTKYVGHSILFGNFSYAGEIPRDDTERENHFEFATAMVHSVSGHVHPTVELFGDRNATEGTTEAYAAPEVIFTLPKGWEVKAAVPIGLTATSDDYGVQVKLSYLMHFARHDPPGP